MLCAGAGADAAGDIGQGGMCGMFDGKEFPPPARNFVGGVPILAWNVSVGAACVAICADALEAALPKMFSAFPGHGLPSPRIGLIDMPVKSCKPKLFGAALFKGDVGCRSYCARSFSNSVCISGFFSDTAASFAVALI